MRTGRPWAGSYCDRADTVYYKMVFLAIAILSQDARISVNRFVVTGETGIWLDWVFAAQ